MLHLRLVKRALLGLLAFSAITVSAQESTELPAFNQLVLEVAGEYPTDGTHGYWWPRNGESSYDGCTQNLFIAGEKVMDGEAEGRTFCCGLTLEVFVEAYNKWVEEHGVPEESALSADNFSAFQRAWFVRETNGPGPSIALEEYGLGVTVPHDEALPGDFMQIWRHSGSGHSVIFKSWERDDAGTITGLNYWSTQPSTGGISENHEAVNPPGSENGVTLEYTYIGRVQMPEVADEAPASAPTSQPSV